MYVGLEELSFVLCHNEYILSFQMPSLCYLLQLRGHRVKSLERNEPK